MLGLEMLAERKILVKVNSVMIPGINDEHLIEVNKVVKAKGAFLHNIMPLISEPEHGTHFGLTGQRGPRAMELKALQDQLSRRNEADAPLPAMPRGRGGIAGRGSRPGVHDGSVAGGRGVRSGEARRVS